MSNTLSPVLRRTTLTNLLSFGPEPVTLELENLNLLIGPNASGKSNLIEALSLLRATPVSGRNSDRDVAGLVRRGVGVAEWIWKGAPKAPASIEAVIGDPDEKDLLRHFLSFREVSQRLLELLGKLNPDTLQQLISFKRTRQILDAKL